MKSFDLGYSTPIIIYGAGIRGQLFHHNLMNSGFSNILLFLDNNADTIHSVLGKKVLAPQSEAVSFRSKADAVVVVSVTNVFEHAAIAARLHSVGFENIICKFIANGSTSQSTRIINDIFDNILDMKYYKTKLKPVSRVPKYSTLETTDSVTDSVLRVIDETYLVAAVPVELVFSLGTQTKLTPYKTEELAKQFGLTKLADEPFFNVSQQICLFEYFETGDSRKLDSYINVIRFNYQLIGKTLKETDLQRIISSRQEVYCHMNHILSVNAEFFRDNPVKLKWNPKGYFNILDGKHRLALFITKGLRQIPSKISKHDYEQWLNPVQLENVTDLSKMRNAVHLLHPSFGHANAISHFHSSTLFSLIKLVSNAQRDLKTLSALCVGFSTMYYFQYFRKIGMRAEQLIVDKEKCSDARTLNKLSYIDESSSKTLSDCSRTKSCRYDILFLSAVTSDFRPESVDTVFDCVDLSVASYCIIICTSGNKEDIASRLRNCSYTHYAQLASMHTDRGQVYSLCFSRHENPVRTSKIKR